MLHQMTKEQRRKIAKRSEEILKKAPFLTLEKIGSRLGITAQRVCSIRKEFGYPSLKKLKGGKGE